MGVNLSLFAGAGWQFFNNNGIPLAGGLIYTYAAGTTTPQATYTSSAGTIAHANPIVLDSAGRVAAGEVWVSEGLSYKFVLKDSTSNTIGTYDNINGTYVATDLANNSDPTLGDALVGFRQSNSSGNLTGAVGRTVHQKLQEFVNILDFGATTSDSTGVVNSSAVNSALSAISSGGELYFPAGTFYFATQLIIQGSVKIRGAGVSVTTLKLINSYGSNTQLITTNSKSGIQFNSLTLDGNYANQGLTGSTDNGQIGVYVQNSSDVSFNNCLFKNWGKDGIYIYSSLTPTTYCTDININACTFDTIRRCGVTMISGKRIAIENNIFRNTTSSVVTNGGITWEPDVANDVLSGLIVNGNIFSSLTAGCRLTNLQSSTADTIVISNNAFQNITGEAGVVVYSLFSGGATIVGNRFSSCGNANTPANYYSYGGGITFSLTDCVFISNNWFKSCTSYAATNTLYGGTIYSNGGGSLCQITNNTFYYDASHGINLGASISGFGSTFRRISGNTFVLGGQTTANTYTAINVNNQNTNKGSLDIISENTITTSTINGYGNGIVINYDDGTSQVINNSINGNGTYYTFTNGVPGGAPYTAPATACTGALTNSISWTAIKVGRVVTLTIPSITGTTTNVSTIQLNAALPTAFRPPQDVYVIQSQVLINNSSVATPGMIGVFNSTGTILLYRDAVSTAWGTDANSGVTNTCISWIV